MAYLVLARLADKTLVEFGSDRELCRGDKVILTVKDFLEFASVESCVESGADLPQMLVRVATDSDKEQYEKIKSIIESDRELILECVKNQNITLRLVAGLRTFDNKKLLVMYTADDRIDFRVLVRELAGRLRLRIEMRQISPRDEASFYGGCGMCGQPLCCRRLRNRPQKTTIKMARIQSSALAPSRINGICGKLMCCLQFEFKQYQEILAKMPPIRSKVSTSQGNGVVEFNDCLREMVAVRLDGEQGVKKFPLSEITVLEVSEVAEKIETEDDVGDDE